MKTELPSGALSSFLARARRVLLTGPAEPDGDSIGSSLALARGIEARFGTEVVVAGELPERYAFLPGVDRLVPPSRVRGPFDLAVVLDGDRRRLEGAVALAFASARATGIVDHHFSSSPEGYTFAYIDPDAASTCEMVVELLDAWGVSLDRELAALLYTGIVFDTGGFVHSNTTAATHRLAARLLGLGIDHAEITTRVLLERSRGALWLMGRVLVGARFLGDGRVVLGTVSLELARELETGPPDCEGVVDHLLYTRGVEVAALLVERAPGEVKISFRSRGRVNVARVARALHETGGGHQRAAGVVLHRPLPEVERAVAGRLLAVLGEA